MSANDHKQALPQGFRLRAYRVVRVLGVGGFGATYLCEYAGLGVQVAVKEYLPNEIAVRDGAGVYPKSPSDREGFEWGLSRFLDEARTLARFEHPNVVRVRDCFGANNTAYIVMDYEDGEPLDALLRRYGTLTEAQLKRLLLPVAEGLRQVHAAGFLHRDIKPSNVFVRRSDESPVLLDFGSARQALLQKSRSLTAIASAGYSPPEQYESHGSHGVWTDIYALCALCHRAITGEAPVEAPRRTGEVARSRADPQKRLATAGLAGYSPGFLEAVDWGLRLIEAERPQSLDEWLARLQDSTSTKPAKAGNAQYDLGAAYADGDGLPKSLEKAALWFRKAAERGLAAAQYDLAVMYDTGEGIPEDANEAALWYGRAAAQGHAAAQNNLGILYRNGKGVPKDDREAARWFRKAAAQGQAKAQANLGSLYHRGRGVARDAHEAARWYRLAAEQGNAGAQRDLGVLYCSGDGVPQDMGEGARWLREAAEQGHAMAQTNLGVLYHTGQGVPKDAHKAALWFQEAAEQGVAAAQNKLGFMYHFGEGVPKDVNEAARWYRRAAEQGDAEGQASLGAVYENGDGVPKDATRAVLWTRRAAEQGHQAAQFNLGLKYAEGQGVPKDAREAVRWCRKAAEQGNADLQTIFGIMYATGHGIPHDTAQACVWLNLAAAQGDEDARRARAQLQRDMTPAEIAQARDLTGITAATYHIERGARTFVHYTLAMAKALGAELYELLKPELRAFYEGIRHQSGSASFRDEMTSYEELDAMAASGELDQVIEAACDAESEYGGSRGMPY